MTTQNNIDLSHLNLAGLRQLQADVQVEIKSREQEEIARARDEIQKIAQGLGMSVADLLGGVGKKGGGDKAGKSPLPARYRHPQDPKKEWTGRGRQPGWIQEWRNGGGTIEQLKVGA